MMQGAIFAAFGGRVKDRKFMTDWFNRRNQAVIDTLPAHRLLVYSPKQGWEPAVQLPGDRMPDAPFPRVNSRDEIGQASKEHGGLPPDPEARGTVRQKLHHQLKAKAFGG